MLVHRYQTLGWESITNQEIEEAAINIYRQAWQTLKGN